MDRRCAARGQPLSSVALFVLLGVGLMRHGSSCDRALDQVLSPDSTNAKGESAMSEETIELLRSVASVLLYCWLLGFALLFIWFAMFMSLRGFIQRTHGAMFGFSIHELDVIHYCGMGIWKLGVILLYLFPWIAIRLLIG
jgi:hypothetical protein